MRAALVAIGVVFVAMAGEAPLKGRPTNGAGERGATAQPPPAPTPLQRLNASIERTTKSIGATTYRMTAWAGELSRITELEIVSPLPRNE